MRRPFGFNTKCDSKPKRHHLYSNVEYTGVQSKKKNVNKAAAQQRWTEIWTFIAAKKRRHKEVIRENGEFSYCPLHINTVSKINIDFAKLLHT